MRIKPGHDIVIFDKKNELVIQDVKAFLAFLTYIEMNAEFKKITRKRIKTDHNNVISTICAFLCLSIDN